MIEVEIQTTAIELKTPIPDPTMFITSLYYERDIYLSNVPKILFSEQNNFIPTHTKLLIKEDSVASELQKISTRYIYIIVHQIQAPKKGKKPADNYSWPELNVQPNQLFQKIDLIEYLQNYQESEQEYITVDEQGKQLVLDQLTPVQTQQVTLTFNLKIKIPNPNFHKLQPFSLFVNNISLFGNLQNYKQQFTSILPFGWGVQLQLPGSKCPVEIAKNGFIKLQQLQTPDVSQLNNYQDLLQSMQNENLSIVFQQTTTEIPVAEIENGLKDLYTKILDPKALDKQKQADSLQILQKFQQYKQQTLKLGNAPSEKNDPKKKAQGLAASQQLDEESFFYYASCLKEAISQSFNHALTEQNNKVLQTADPKKKPQIIQQINFVLDGDYTKFLTHYEQFQNNGKVLFLQQSQIQQLRQSIVNSEIHCKLIIKPDQFWQEQYSVNINNFECFANASLRPLKYQSIALLGNLPLQFVPQQLEQGEIQPTLQNKSQVKNKIATTTKQKQEEPEPVNLLIQNYSTISTTFIFTNTELLHNQNQIIDEIKSIFPSFKVFIQKLQVGNARFGKRLIPVEITQFQQLIFENVYLPPSKKQQNPIDEVYNQFKKEIFDVYIEVNDGNHKAYVEKGKPILQKYKTILQDMFKINITDAHARLMHLSNEVIQENQEKMAQASELIEYANILVNVNRGSNAKKCMKLYGQAITRQLKNLQQGQKTPMLEEACLGQVKATIVVTDTHMQERIILRVCQLAAMCPLENMELAIIAACVLAEQNEIAIALCMLVNVKDVFEFDLQNIKRSLLIKILIAVLLNQFGCLNESGELFALIVQFVRQNNTNTNLLHGDAQITSLMEGLSENHSDEYIIESLKLCLAEYLALQRISEYPRYIVANIQAQLDQLKIAESYNQLKIPDEVRELYKNGIVQVSDDQCVNKQEMPQCTEQIDEKYIKLQMRTKCIMIICRILFGKGRHNETRNLLLKQGFFRSKEGEVDSDAPLNLLKYMQSGELIKGSYLQLFDDQQLDTTIPGLLTTYGMSNEMQHKIPALLLIQNTKLPSLIVCGALNGMIQGKAAMQIQTDNSFPLPIKKSKLDQLLPKDIVVTRNTIKQLRELNANSVLNNSKIALDMIYIAYCLGLQDNRRPGYTGLLDCNILTGYNFEDDILLCSVFQRLSTRYLPLLNNLDFPVPYKKPSADEVSVAQRIFEQVQKHKFQGKVNPIVVRFTNDFLSQLVPQDIQSRINLVRPILLKMLNQSKSFQHPRQLVSFGLQSLMLQQTEVAISAFQRALQTDSASSEAWSALAVTLSNQLTFQNDPQLNDKLRQKICEAVNRINHDDPHYFPVDEQYVAISQSILDQNSIKSTYYAATALKLLEKVQLQPDLTRIVPFVNQLYTVKFTQNVGFMSAWHVNRLRAAALKSCGRARNVAAALEMSIASLGGQKPGASVEEIAERILLLSEAAEAYEEAGDYQQGQKTMIEGLQ